MSISETNAFNSVGDAARQQAAAKAVRPLKAQEAPAELVHKPVKVDLPVKAEDKQKNLRDAIDQLNQQMIKTNQHLGFELNDHVKGPVITVHNTTTGEVVRKIPSEEVLRVAQSIDSLKGVIFSKNF
jgi:uncharacterized FlaG/YvyC family protein